MTETVTRVGIEVEVPLQSLDVDGRRTAQARVQDRGGQRRGQGQAAMALRRQAS